jgi:hypothetical protein
MNSFYLVTTFLLTALSFGPENAAGLPTLQQAEASVENLAKQSSFAFAGTVQKLNASNVPVVTGAENTAVVRVDQVVQNAGVVTDVLGQEITVELQSAGGLKQGEQALFFTNVSTYGDTIAVREVGHLPWKPEGLEATRAQVNASAARLPDEQLQKRIAQADLVVAGSVTSVKPAPETAQRPPGSEHDPEWWIATVKVQSAFKGQAPHGDLEVLFPHSQDLRWFASPKFQPGQAGVFLLHRTEDEKLRARGYTVLDRLDFQPMEQRDRIRKLMPASR